MCLPKFDIYQGILASNCFKTHTNSWCPSFFQKKVLSNVRPQIALFFIFTINIVNLIYLRILWILKIWRLLQKIRKKLSESFLLTQWNAIRNDNTSSQKVLFFFYFFFRCHVTVKNKFVIILRKLKIYWAYLIIQMTNRLLDGKVTNILLFVLTLFLSSCYFLTNKN